MNREKVDALQKRFPKFFVDLWGDPKETCLAFGIETRDGWYGLIESLCERIGEAPPEFKFTQIKEKFGLLRIYSRGGTVETNGLIDSAENASRWVCEVCGGTNHVSTGGTGWITTLCQGCRAQRESLTKVWEKGHPVT